MASDRTWSSERCPAVPAEPFPDSEPVAVCCPPVLPPWFCAVWPGDEESLFCWPVFWLAAVCCCPCCPCCPVDWVRAVAEEEDGLAPEGEDCDGLLAWLWLCWPVCPAVCVWLPEEGEGEEGLDCVGGVLDGDVVVLGLDGAVTQPVIAHRTAATASPDTLRYRFMLSLFMVMPAIIVIRWP